MSKIESRITFRKNAGCYFELLMLETMKLHEDSKSKIAKDKNGKNVPHLEITEVVIMRCNIVNNDYQQDSRVLYPFVPYKSFGQLFDISPKIIYFQKAFDSEFLYIKVWFTDQNSKLLEVGNKTNITLFIN